MQYILNEEEMKALVSRREFELQKKALRVALNLIVPLEKCQAMYYCDDCPIYQIEDQFTRNVICDRPKRVSQ